MIGEPIGPKGVPSQVSTNLADLPYYALRSVFRMFVALFFSLVFTFIYGTAAARCRRLSRVLIPLSDILQSVPILGFLSATITIWMVLFPGSMLGVEAASIFAIFTSQAWNMAFSLHRSLTSEPTELDEAARSLQLTRWQRFWTLDVPNAMIPLLWNCMMSVGGGWFFLTASEMILGEQSHLRDARHRQLRGTGGGRGESRGHLLGHRDDGAGGAAYRRTAVEAADRVGGEVPHYAKRVGGAQDQCGADHHSSVTYRWMVAWLFRPVDDLFDTLTRPLGRTGGRWAADVEVRTQPRA